jgi:hypothetical protein
MGNDIVVGFGLVARSGDPLLCKGSEDSKHHSLKVRLLILFMVYKKERHRDYPTTPPYWRERVRENRSHNNTFVTYFKF